MRHLTRIGLAVNHSSAYYRGVLRGVGHYAETKPHWLFSSVIPEERSLIHGPVDGVWFVGRG